MDAVHSPVSSAIYGAKSHGILPTTVFIPGLPERDLYRCFSDSTTHPWGNMSYVLYRLVTPLLSVWLRPHQTLSP